MEQKFKNSYQHLTWTPSTNLLVTGKQLLPWVILMLESVFAQNIQFITKRIYIGRGNELINLEFMESPKKKLIQFANIFHLLRVG
jgi:hypothetical protein